MAPYFSLLFPNSFFSILLLNFETVTDGILACTHHFNHLVSVTAGGPEFPPRALVAKFYVRLQLIRSALRESKFSVLKFIEIVILRIYYMASISASASFGTFVTSLFNFFNYFVWLKITDEDSIPFMVHIVNEIRFKMVYTYWSLFIFQPLHSLGECHYWWTRESLRAPAAKFYGRLQLIRIDSRASTFSVLKFLEIVILGVSSPSILASVCFGTFVTSLANLFSYFVWLRIPDDGSVLEMRIWSILLSLFSYCKSQAFTLNTLWGFCKIYAQSTFFVLAEGGVNFNIKSLYFHFVIKFRLLLSICGLHFWCPLNLKMLPTPLEKLLSKKKIKPNCLERHSLCKEVNWGLPTQHFQNVLFGYQ